MQHDKAIEPLSMSQRNLCGHTSKNKPRANQIQTCKCKWEKRKKKESQNQIHLQS